MSRTKSEHLTLLDELAEVFARANEKPDLLFVYRNPDNGLGMRVCGLGANGDRWIAIAMLEWAKHEILNDDSGWKPGDPQ